MGRDRNVQTKMVRLGQILRIFMQKEKVASSWLSEYFQTTPRTIQRDLLLLKKSGFAIHEITKGNYTLNKDLIKHLEVFDDTELALVVALKNVVGQLGKPFEKAASDVLNRLYETVTAMPVFVKIGDAVPMDAALVNKIVKAVRERRQVGFGYTGNKGSHTVVMAPYRIVYYEGFWYLIGDETSTGILKRYALDRIRDFHLLKSGFRSIPADLDSVLKGSANIWFAGEANLTIKVLIDAKVAHYFKRRKMFPTQEIKEEKPDGSLIVTFRVGNFEAIRDILKSWIPNILILEPENIRKAMLRDIKDWVKRQE